MSSPRVEAVVTEEVLEGDYGPQDGVVATCTRCDHQTESFGTGDASIRRCLVLLREECPRGERNYYVDEDDV
jgi:hypothetical protein